MTASCCFLVVVALLMDALFCVFVMASLVALAYSTCDTDGVGCVVLSLCMVLPKAACFSCKCYFSAMC